jgi:hypothetical protein
MKVAAFKGASFGVAYAHFYNHSSHRHLLSISPNGHFISLPGPGTVAVAVYIYRTVGFLKPPHETEVPAAALNHFWTRGSLYAKPLILALNLAR